MGCFQRPARGYDITTQGYLPFYRQIGGSLSYEQYLGDNVDLFGSGKKQSDPRAMQLGLNYTRYAGDDEGVAQDWRGRAEPGAG
jgi:Protein of unknown function (DUF3442).